MSDDYFGKNEKKWKWSDFKSTKNFPIPDELLEWVIGQDRALEECELCIDEWLQKLLDLKEKKWWKVFEDPEGDKPPPKEWLPSGPFLLMLGDAGTGKSLIGRALSTYMTKLYKEKGIELNDVLSWKNKTIPSNPKISIHRSGMGKKIVKKLRIEALKKNRFVKWGFRLLEGLMFGFGSFILGITFYNIGTSWFGNNTYGIPVSLMYNGNFISYLIDSLMANVMMIYLGIGILSMGAMLFIFKHIVGKFGGTKGGIGGAESIDSPKLLIDNSSGRAPFIDATGHGSSQLFGSIAWDPYQEYSEDTLILTPQGWKLIGEVKEKDLVITLNRETERVEIQPIDWTFSKFVDGKAVNFKNQHLDLIVDQNHAIYNAKNKERERAGEYIDRKVTFTRLANWEGKIIPKSNTFLKFVAWYITEGSSFIDGKHRRIKICQVKDQTKVARIMDIVKNLDMRCSYDGKDIRIHHAPKEVFEYVQALGTSSLDKKIPEEIKNASKWQLKTFFEELVKGDGREYGYNARKYWTSSFRLCADIQEIALKLGYGTTVWTDDRKQGWTKNTSYCITIVKNGIFPVKGQLIPYKGKMYCVGVPNGVVFVMRNGKPVWCGNTGGLGTPEHQRVTAGDVHHAHLGVLYIDEIKNLKGAEATTLLTVLEDGQLSIALRSQMHGGDTSAMAVSTEPVPCLNFFIGAGNMDSVPMIHPALMDRIAGYGKVVYMNNDMPNNVENRRKCIQFISQEIKRFNLLPFSREACIEIIEESRRKSGRKDRLVTKFRPLISIIKTASIVSLNRHSKVVEAKDVKEAIEWHCKSIHRQVLERFIETKKVYAVINPNAEPKIGQIHAIGITGSGDSKEMIGSILPIRASIQKTKKKQSGYFHITGVRTDDDTWVQQSILKVRHVIIQLYNEDPEDSRTHIDFSQQIDVDGPSAGVAMTLALISIIEKKPLRQDVAVTGEVNIGVGKKVLVTPIGGTHEKIMAAQRLGFKKVLIPQKNYEYDIIPKDYKIKVVGCATLEDYKREIF